MSDFVQQALNALNLGSTSNIFTETPQKPKAEPEAVVSDQVVVEIPTENKAD
jgi:hypothetical protein